MITNAIYTYHLGQHIASQYNFYFDLTPCQSAYYLGKRIARMSHVPSVSNDTSPQVIIPHEDFISRLLKSNGTQSQKRQLKHQEWFHWYQLDIRPAGSTTHIYTGLVFGKLPAYGEVNGNIDCNWYQYQQKSSEMWTSSKKKLCTLTPMLPIRYFVISVHNPKCAKTPPNRKEAVKFDTKILSERGWGRFGFIPILLVAILL